MKHASLGSISCGTMQSEDLIPVFLDELKNLDPERAKGIQKEVDKLQVDESVTWGTTYKTDDRVYDDLSSDELADYILNEDLFDALNEYAPPFSYFGSHPGDGANYGFWISYDAIDNARFDEDMLVIEDYSSVVQWEDIAFPLVDYDYVLHVNDHGNMILYDKQGNEVWAVV